MFLKIEKKEKNHRYTANSQKDQWPTGQGANLGAAAKGHSKHSGMYKVTYGNHWVYLGM